MKNREILFRGKRVDGKGWVYGYYVYRPDGKHLIYWNPFDEASQNTYHEVIPETVCQFTGLLDMNGTKIFEGDIIKSKDWNPMEYKVIFEEGEFCFVSLDGVENPFTNSIHYARSFQITGTIHDNPTP